MSKLDFVELTLNAPLLSTSTSFAGTIAKKYRKGQDDGGNPQYYDLEGQLSGQPISNFRIFVQEKGGERVENMKIVSFTEDGATTDNRKIYTFTFATDGGTVLRGLPNDGDGVETAASVITENIVDVFPQGSTLRIVWDTAEQNKLDNTFTENSTTGAEVAGEAMNGVFAVSLHTDNKYYKYHHTNYPNLQGTTAPGTNAAIDGNFTLYNLNALSTGHLGLTPGEFVFAENGGILTQVISGTTKMLGKAKNATQIDHAVNTLQAPELSSAQVEDENSTLYGLINGQLLSAFSGHLGEVRQFALSLPGSVTKAFLQSKNWAICDGTTPVTQGITTPTIAVTPDLSNKFIRASDDDVSGAMGGAETHDHTYSGTTDIYNSGNLADSTGGGAVNGHDHDYSGTTDGASNIPPYYELVFFIKVK